MSLRIVYQEEALVGLDNVLKRWYQQLPSLKRDFEDWMLHATHFRSLDREFGPISVTACADIHGRNSHTRRLWSSIDSCMDHLWYNMLVWCNPPLFHDRPDPTPFHTLQDRSPIRNGNANPSPSLDRPVMIQMHQAMPDMFVLKRWWRTNTDLFSAPPLGTEVDRQLVGSTRWDVEVYYAHPGTVIDTPPAEFMSSRP